MDTGVALIARCDEIQLGIVCGLAAKLLMMDLKFDIVPHDWQSQRSAFTAMSLWALNRFKAAVQHVSQIPRVGVQHR